jgi:Rrf2 family protein
MPLLPRKGLLAIAAVIDVALHSGHQPVVAKALAHRHRLPPRHLEPVLQALVRQGVLKGIRGPRGGYQLAREARHITADDILRAIGTIGRCSQDVGAADGRSRRRLPRMRSRPRNRTCWRTWWCRRWLRPKAHFSGALNHINIEELAGAAQLLKKSFA